MTNVKSLDDDDHLDRVHELVEILTDAIDRIVDDELSQETEEVQNDVKERLQEKYRFW